MQKDNQVIRPRQFDEPSSSPSAPKKDARLDVLFMKIVPLLYGAEEGITRFARSVVARQLSPSILSFRFSLLARTLDNSTSRAVLLLRQKKTPVWTSFLWRRRRDSNPRYGLPILLP